MIFVIFIIAGVIIALYIAFVVRKRTSNCKKMTTTNAALSSISAKNKMFTYRLRDYMIKSSYNSCAAGNFKNDWVDLCALKNAIRQGCRLLDFEVYSIAGETGVSVSTTTSFNEKNALNWLPIEDVVQSVADLAFATTTCPNFNDPLLLHFRVKSTNVEAFNDIADALETHLSHRLLANKFNYEANGTNITAMPLAMFIGKVIIVVDKSNPLVETTRLDEFMNLGSNSVFCRLLSNHDVIYTPDMQELVEFNKQNVTICLPDLGSSAANYDSVPVYNFGVQFCAMCLQTDDDYLKEYNSTFATAGYAFILKPENLRYEPVTVEEAPPLDKSLSYGYTEHQGKYYNFKM